MSTPRADNLERLMELAQKVVNQKKGRSIKEKEEIKAFSAKLNENKNSLVGWSIGKIIVIDEVLPPNSTRNRTRYWKCLCACKNFAVLSTSQIPTTAHQIIRWQKGSSIFETSCYTCSLSTCSVCQNLFKKKKHKYCSMQCKRREREKKLALDRERYATDEDFKNRALARAMLSRERKKTNYKKKEEQKAKIRKRYAEDEEYRARKKAIQQAYRQRKFVIEN